ncbi:MAG TPA: alpha-ribazole phosphatase family protein [Desulfuromonadales bacterium]|nr:alpha-ribazole phosphatase family protein [Desulfuromonadales bacterium]
MSRAGFAADLLRHGETGSNGFRGRLDEPLTPTGWEQMRRGAQAGGPWQAVVSSPLSRCAAFAEAFAGQACLPLEYDQRLAELDFGDWEGLSAERVMQDQPELLKRFWSDPWSCTPPGGESLAAFEGRIRAAWTDLARCYQGQDVLVVTHSGVIRLSLCLAQKLGRGELLQVDVPYGSLHRIAFNGDPGR